MGKLKDYAKAVWSVIPSALRDEAKKIGLAFGITFLSTAWIALPALLQSPSLGALGALVSSALAAAIASVVAIISHANRAYRAAA